jgi:hypothetical protein
MTDVKNMPTDDKCLYISGFDDTVSQYRCNPGKCDEKTVNFIVKTLEDIKDNEILSLPSG